MIRQRIYHNIIITKGIFHTGDPIFLSLYNIPCKPAFIQAPYKHLVRFFAEICLYFVERISGRFLLSWHLLKIVPYGFCLAAEKDDSFSQAQGGILFREEVFQEWHFTQLVPIQNCLSGYILSEGASHGKESRLISVMKTK